MRLLGQWPCCSISRGLSPTSLLSRGFRAREASLAQDYRTRMTTGHAVTAGF